jgi:LPS sulfotransferase NodH
MRQCFIISQPRAGSTLLQRLLATHPEIQTVGEPWLAIPFVYALREKGVSAEYIHISLAQGFAEFVSKLPHGRADYFAEVRAMLERLQAKIAAPGKTWFLDKTPRYHLVLDELAEIFPDAKFIVLWRNPLAVVASILNTWQKGRFDLRYYEQDIFGGPRNILRFVEEQTVALHTLRYEDLVAAPEAEVRRVTDFLRLPPLARVALPENDPLKEARLGDKTGIHKFQSVSAASVEDWKRTFASPVRRHWARGYLRFLGREALHAMGYALEDLLGSLRTTGTSPALAASDLRTLGLRTFRAFARPPFYKTTMKTKKPHRRLA